MSLRLKSLGEEENDSSFASPLGVRRYASPQERLTDPNAMQGIMRKCYGA